MPVAAGGGGGGFSPATCWKKRFWGLSGHQTPPLWSLSLTRPSTPPPPPPEVHEGCMKPTFSSSPEGLFTPKTRVFSAAEILLRIYQNPIHLNGARWRTTFSVGELHAASKTSSANGSHLNVWDFDISSAEFPQQKKRASLV